MPPCTCIKLPNKYVTEPKKAGEMESEVSSINEVQSIVTDSEVFDHEALLKKEGSTTYDDGTDYSSHSSNSSMNLDETRVEQESATKKELNEFEVEEDEDDMDMFSSEKLRNTVEKWNELLKEYDAHPDVIEVQEALDLVSQLPEKKDDEETQKKIEETIKRLTSSLADLRLNSQESLPESQRELVLQPYVGDDEETYFRCFVRKLREQTGNAEVELEVNETVAENIQVLFNSLGLSRRTLSIDKANFLTRMSTSIKSSTVFKNLFDPLDVTKSSMDLTTYLHQLSNEVENEDLASVSTLSEVEVGRTHNPVSNCLLNTSLLLDETVCNCIRRQNKEFPAFCVKQLQKQVMLRNRYGDMSDLPLFIS